jgi:AraC family transcriptional regulator of adaptative response / DNA-3-methyladenine glycosylase II
VHDDFDRCYRAVQSRDARFDGWFVTAVLTTGIYCRPSCPVRLPLARNVRFFATAAAAQQAGFRACKRCLPDASPGSPLWNVRGDVVARAMRLIGDGTVDREGVGGLAGRLGYTARQLERLLQGEVGAGPLALARAQRVQTARILIETTSMSFSDVAFAAGFSGIRQFNDTLRTACGSTPTMLRSTAICRQGESGAVPAGQTVAVRLAVREPFAYEGVFGHLAASAVPGCEEVRDGVYRRTVRLPFGTGIVGLRPRGDHVLCTVALQDLRDLSAAIGRCRRLLDLDADPEAVIEALSADDALQAVVARAPGPRIPGTVDPHELAVRAVLGQQVSTSAARTHTRRLVEAYGTRVADSAGGLTHLFPTVEQLAEIDPAHLAVPRARRTSLQAMVSALAAGDVGLDFGADWQQARQQLMALPGIGPWTTEIIAMRGLGDPDAFPASDLGVLNAAGRSGLPDTAPALIARGERWRPWRSYVTQHLWATLDHPVNQWPPKETAS